MRDAGRNLAGLLAVVLALAWPGPLLANDTMAVFGAGGLQFEQTDKLRMEREELYLSPLEVRVSYVFRNLTDQDVRGRVAFPMPEINISLMSETPHKFNSSTREGDIFDFRVEVNGRPVEAEYEARAYINATGGSEKDVTDVLKQYRLDLIDPAHVGLDKKIARKLIKLGIVMDDDVHHPLWSVRATYHWIQVFPARQEVQVTHRYKPVLGGSVFPADIDPNKPPDYAAKWCPDEAFARAVKKMPADSANYVLSLWLEYILKTGANWAGPIGKFRLEIDKGTADLISLCPIPGLKLQRRGKSFVAEAAQYTPTTDLKVLFVYRACDKAPCSKEDWPGYPR